jgi:hypothetical protein
MKKNGEERKRLRNPAHLTLSEPFFDPFSNSAKLLGGLGPWVVFQRERMSSSGPGFPSG